MVKPFGRGKQTDLQDLIKKDDETEKNYIDSTAFEQQNLDITTNFNNGSIKLTPEISGIAKVAVEKFISSTKKYTSARIDKINENIESYLNTPGKDSDGLSECTLYYPETFNAVEDWTDDLYLIFADMADQLEMKDIEDGLSTFLTKVMPVNESEESSLDGGKRSLIQKIFGKKNTEETSTYFFQQKDAIKSLIKHVVKKSGFEKKLLPFLFMGVASGQFIVKDTWGKAYEKQLSLTEDGQFVEFSQAKGYQFTPIDPRMVIFGQESIDPIVEIINTTFHSLLEICLDENNNPVEAAPYDIEQLQKLGEYLKEQGGTSAIRKTSMQLDEVDVSSVENNDLWDILGEITLYQSHGISMPMQGADGKKRVYQAMMTYVDLAANQQGYPSQADVDLFPIGIQKTPYVAGFPFTSEPFVEKNNDIAGLGLPEIIRPLQKILNNFVGLTTDLMEFALYGVMVIDPRKIKNANLLKKITPKMIIQLKDIMGGLNINDVVQWLHVPTEIIGQMEGMFHLFESSLKRTTRRGPTGEKISPNPTATEFTSIMEELQKSVNKTGLRLNNLFTTVLERMYLYTVFNIEGYVKLKTQGFKIKDINSVREQEQGIMSYGTSEDRTIVDRTIELTPKELFIEGLSFKLIALDAFNKKATERQQIMQVIKLLSESGAIVNADGTPKVMTDETGASVRINEYELWNKALRLFGVEDIFEKVTPQKTEMGTAGASLQGVPPSAPATDSAAPPGLSASPLPGDIAAATANLGKA